MLFYAFRGFERVRFMILNLLVYLGGASGASAVNQTGHRPSFDLGASVKGFTFRCNHTCGGRAASASSQKRARSNRSSPGRAVQELQVRHVHRRSGPTEAGQRSAEAEVGHWARAASAMIFPQMRSCRSDQTSTGNDFQVDDSER
uniref:Uncharacterized protein LOC104218161 n=1 Tax=Nicotiana sylvestris TaxID=4096 RepID=A0A1U7VY20_NICSY|nr:PREDICTED: uncharacterized protein LOC104218161 [Nicotiana sylvestris]